MNFLIVLASVIAVTIAQRPTYAGLSSKGYPELASRFRDPADDQDGSNVNNVAVGNRLGADDQSSLNVPTDARGDVVLVNRLNEWPRENRPFWLINSEQIERHRHPNENINQNRNTIPQGTQQRLNEVQPSLNREQQTSRVQEPVQPALNRNEQVQSRFDESVASETRTIKPLSQRGSFAGERTF